MKVIIIGKSNGWLEAPQEGNTWGVNTICLRRPVDLVFQMHDIKPGSVGRTKSIEYAKTNNIPIVMQKEHQDIPTSIEYPLDEMHCKYFTSSIAYMIAYAIYKGATEIDIYGVHMGLETEYTEQKACADYWIGYARGLGIEVIIYGNTALCGHSTKLYAYEEK